MQKEDRDRVQTLRIKDNNKKEDSLKKTNKTQNLKKRVITIKMRGITIKKENSKKKTPIKV